MNREARRSLAVMALVLVPALAWALTTTRGKSDRLAVLQAQREEVREREARYLELQRRRQGIVLDRPFRFSAAVTETMADGVIAVGKSHLVWVASTASRCWTDASLAGWRHLVQQYPQLRLIALAPELSEADSPEFLDQTGVLAITLLSGPFHK